MAALEKPRCEEISASNKSNPKKDRKVKSCVSSPPVHQQANAPVEASRAGATRCQADGRWPDRRRLMRTTKARVPTPNATPRKRDVATGPSPSLIPAASNTVHKKLVKPSTRSPRLNTSWPCSARLEA